MKRMFFVSRLFKVLIPILSKDLEGILPLRRCLLNTYFLCYRRGGLFRLARRLVRGKDVDGNAFVPLDWRLFRRTNRGRILFVGASASDGYSAVPEYIGKFSRRSQSETGMLFCRKLKKIRFSGYSLGYSPFPEMLADYLLPWLSLRQTVPPGWTFLSKEEM